MMQKTGFLTGILSLILVIIFSGCAKKEATCTIVEKDGVKHYQNRNFPADPSLKFVTDAKFTIEGNTGDSLVSFSSASDIEIDDEGNFYIFDPRQQKVYKYDPSGKFILSFCGKGNGPAEIDGAQDIAIVGDSITICSPGAAKGTIFDKDGNFGYHSTVFIPGLYYGVVDVGLNDSEILGFNPTFNAEKDQVLIGNELVIKNKKYEKKVVLHTIPADKNPMDIEGAKIIFMPFSCFKDDIYFAPNFPESYSIHHKDRNGSLLSVISKHAARIEYNPEEKKHYEVASSFSWNGEKIIPNCRLKSVMNGIYNDKFGNLLVWVSQKRTEGVKHNPSIDIFKDGEYQNSIILKEVEIVESHTPTDVTFYFKKDKLIVFNINDNIFSIYDYHYESTAKK